MQAKIFHNSTLLLILAVFFWSGNFIVGRAFRFDLTPVTLAFWRWAIATIVVLFLARKHIRQDIPAMLAKWPVVLILAFTGVACFNTLVYKGLQSTVAVNALLVNSMIPVCIVVFSYVFFRENISLIQGLGVGLSLCGVLAIASTGRIGVLLDLEVNHGDVYVFVAVLCYAVYSVMLRRRPLVHPLSLVAVIFFLGTLFLLPVYLLQAKTFFPVLPLSSYGAIFYVALFPSIISYLCFNRGVELAGANRAGIFIHLMPVFGSLMAIVFLGERLHWYHALGIGCIALGIKLSTKKQ